MSRLKNEYIFAFVLLPKPCQAMTGFFLNSTTPCPLAPTTSLPLHDILLAMQHRLIVKAIKIQKVNV